MNKKIQNELEITEGRILALEESDEIIRLMRSIRGI